MFEANFEIIKNEPIQAKFEMDLTPDKLSQLENDMGYITLNDIPDVDIPEVPTKLSELDNDMGYITLNDIPETPTKLSELENDTGFITEDDIPSLPDNLVTQDDLATVATSGSYEDLTNKPTIPTIPDIPVTDVQVNGASILNDGVANIPIAASSRLGVVFPAGFGVMVTASGALAIIKATDALINAKTNNYQPVVPSNLDYAVKVGVTTNTNTLTDTEKQNACNWLGAGHQRTTVIDSTTPTIVLDKALANTDYQYGIITSLSITEVENSYLETNIFFTAGAEIAVDLPDTLKIIGDLSFEAEKQYVMSICNNTLIAGVVS